VRRKRIGGGDQPTLGYLDGNPRRYGHDGRLRKRQCDWGALVLGKSRDKVITLPEFAMLAVYKLPRLLDSLFLVCAFEAFYGRKVSIIPKSINSILMHALHSASSDAEARVGENVTIFTGCFSCVCKTAGISSPVAARVQSLAKLRNCLRCSSVRALAAHLRQSRAYV
jgi:hypothetical protein